MFRRAGHIKYAHHPLNPKLANIGFLGIGVMLLAKELSRTKNGPPGLKDMVHANGDAQRFLETRSETSKVLGTLGLSWDADVEDVIPIRGIFYPVAEGARPQSYRHRIGYRVLNQSRENIRKALEKGLASRPMFRTVLVKLLDRTPIHVVLRPSKPLLDNIITEKECDEDAVQGMIEDDTGSNFSLVQMVQVVIVHSPNSTSLILTYNHSIFDALSMMAWMRDLDLLIGNPDYKLLSSTPFKLFADMAYSHRDSLPAQEDVQYVVKRLTGIGQQTKAFWPPQRAPGWIVATDRDCEFRDKRMQARKEAPIQYPKVWKTSKVPFASLKSKDIQPFILVKAAIVLFNVMQTVQEYAIFNTIDAGRIWPFMPAWIPLPPAMSIDGPTMEWTANMLRVLPEETVEHLLNRVQEDQEELTLHAHAPIFKVLDELKTEGTFAIDALKRQTFNWDISLQYLKETNNTGELGLDSMKMIDRIDWPDW